ncbi:MAG: hypothetical protein GY839_10305 [candidate division Zixibacteria bacterium]|nr:hypothetical protein [candidate division Zixibacteria bacterium]
MKYACLISFITVLSVSAVLNAQPADSLWFYTYGDENDNVISNIIQTNDAGFLLIGTTDTETNEEDIYLVKLNSDGDSLWTRTYGDYSIDKGYDAFETNEGDFIIVGNSYSYGNEMQVYIILTDSIGDINWFRTYGGEHDDYALDIEKDSNGDFILTGYTRDIDTQNRDLLIIKVNPNGDSLWATIHGEDSRDVGISTKATPDGGYIVNGSTWSYGSSGGSDFWLIKFNDQDEQIWNNTYGTTLTEHSKDFDITADGGYILVGSTWSQEKQHDFYIVKTDSAGNLQWSQSFGGNLDDHANGIKEGIDGEYLIIGGTRNFGAGSTDLYITKLTSSGDVIWTKTYGDSHQDVGGSFVITDQNDCVIGGNTNSFGNGFNDLLALKITNLSPLMYLPGDVNMYNGAWPPSVIGGDVTFLVNYFRSLPSSQACLLGGFWASADANGDCNIIGSDVTRLVNYFRGLSDITSCPDYPAAWLTLDDLPLETLEGWPNCE